MKKNLFMLTVIAVIICALLVGCNNGEKTPTEENFENAEQSASVDFMEKYISQLPSNQAREDFLGFFNSMYAYCFDIELTFEREGNIAAYEFDPSDAVSIPAEIKDKYSFEKIKFFNGFQDHKNYNMKLDGNKVELSFDGEVFYPTIYGYEDIKSLIEKYNA